MQLADILTFSEIIFNLMVSLASLVLFAVLIEMLFVASRVLQYIKLLQDITQKAADEAGVAYHKMLNTFESLSLAWLLGKFFKRDADKTNTPK